MTVLKNVAPSSYSKNNESPVKSELPINQWEKALIPINSTIQQAITCLDNAAMQIVMVIDKRKELVGTITDGDIRRGLLSGLQLNSSIDKVVKKEAFVVPESMDTEIILKIMSANSIRQIPIINADRKVVGLHTWENLSIKSEIENPMVIMAGGKGTRLQPITENCPKPLLPVYGKPIMEHIIIRAISEGFSSFYVSVNYLSHMIENYFGDGEKWGVKINYICEDKPLGTAGALTFLRKHIKVPFLVTNGDVLTHMRYSEFLDFHINHHADATMAVRIHEWQNPFGVVNIEGLNIVGLEEKPIARSHINAGIYALDPAVFNHLKEEQNCDMTTLFERIRKSGNKTVAYPMHEPWIDIGRPDDFELAENYVQENVGQEKLVK